MTNHFRWAIALPILLVVFSALPLPGRTDDYHYAPRDGGFWIHNGPAYFNRPLFGTHESSMLLSGGRPAFANFAPTNLEKIGDLYIGLITAQGGSGWIRPM